MSKAFRAKTIEVVDTGNIGIYMPTLVVIVRTMIGK